MQDRMKFFDHEGTEYVTVFSEHRDPVTIGVDQLLSWCLLHGTQFGVTLFYNQTIYGETVPKQKCFTYSTPNLAQAILKELGAEAILARIDYPDVYQNTKI
jgi:hypothetical protein